MLIAAGVVLLLFAMRFVAAAAGCGFSPFTYLGLPGAYGWHVVLFAALVAACAVLLFALAGTGRDALWMAAAGGGVLVPRETLVRLLRDRTQAHPEVVRADAAVRARRGRPSAKLEVVLRPMVDGDEVEAELASVAREWLADLTGVADVKVRVSARVLKVRQLARNLP